MEGNELQYTIRPGTEKDAEAIVGMIRELAVFEGKLDRCHVSTEKFCRDGFGANPAFHSLIVEIKSKSSDTIEAIGYAICYYAYSTYKGKIVYLEDVYVKEKYRQHGIGRDLVKSVAKFGLENGCALYRFSCLGWNENALKFYKSIGAKNLTEQDQWHTLQLEMPEMESFVKNCLALYDIGDRLETYFSPCLLAVLRRS